MATREEIARVVLDAIDDFNAQHAGSEQLDKALDTALYGEESVLDSLALVNLVVAAEARLQDAFGASVTIADERAMSQNSSPFRTVETLVTYVEGLLAEDGDG